MSWFSICLLFNPLVGELFGKKKNSLKILLPSLEVEKKKTENGYLSVHSTSWDQIMPWKMHNQLSSLSFTVGRIESEQGSFQSQE